MRVVSWNCNGALRKKLNPLSSFDADIYVIQECENPAQTNSNEYKNWCTNYLWIGDNKNKGLGIFAKQDIVLTPITLDSELLKYFIPCKVNDKFVLLAVWAMGAETFSYIGQIWKYLQLHKDNFKEQDAIIVGDFNSNAIWDKPKRYWNHSNVIEELRDLEIESLYHMHTGEAQGKETLSTFYLYRKLERPYHIDYAFIAKNLLQVATFTIGKHEWLEFSDHLPLIIDLTSTSP